jgi:transposase
MDISVLGIDLANVVCRLAGLNNRGAVAFRKRIQRHRLLEFIAKLPACVVAMAPVAARTIFADFARSIFTRRD